METLFTILYTLCVQKNFDRAVRKTLQCVRYLEKKVNSVTSYRSLCFANPAKGENGQTNKERTSLEMSLCSWHCAGERFSFEWHFACIKRDRNKYMRLYPIVNLLFFDRFDGHL